MGWLHDELFPVATKFTPDAPVSLSRDVPRRRSVVEAEVVYDPGVRKATQTVEVKLGDPNLAYQGFKARVAGDGDMESTDLGALKGPVAHS